MPSVEEAEAALQAAEQEAGFAVLHAAQLAAAAGLDYCPPAEVDVDTSGIHKVCAWGPLHAPVRLCESAGSVSNSVELDTKKCPCTCPLLSPQRHIGPVFCTIRPDAWCVCLPHHR